MRKAKNVKEFVERADAAKKLNPKDLSADQDLTIAIMNLISIEEHLVFSGAKTGKSSFYDMIQDVRELRKNLMLKVIPSYEGEVWCISKHLLAASMRLMEVGTKQQSMGRAAEAYKLFNQAYDLYCLFWSLNMNLVDVKDVKWIQDSEEDVKKVSQQLEKLMPAAAGKKAAPASASASASAPAPAPETGFAKFKSFIKKAVDCCIE